MFSAFQTLSQDLFKGSGNFSLIMLLNANDQFNYKILYAISFLKPSLGFSDTHGPGIFSTCSDVSNRTTLLLFSSPLYMSTMNLGLIQVSQFRTLGHIGLEIYSQESSAVQEPLIFLKPTSSYIREGSAVEIPSPCTFLDHEVELGVVIGKKGRDISESQAMDHVSGMQATPF